MYIYITKIKGKIGHEFEREQGGCMAGFGGRKRKTENMKLYHVLKNINQWFTKCLLLIYFPVLKIKLVLLGEGRKSPVKQ